MISRRAFVGQGAGLLLARCVLKGLGSPQGHGTSFQDVPPAYSVTPVVGDGNWIWNEPPHGETGYLEPRPYEAEIGIELEGLGSNTQFMATTPVPVAHPEQRIKGTKIETQGCQAAVRTLTDGAAQLFVRGAIGKGRLARAVARYELTLLKQYHGYERDMFPDKQVVPKTIQRGFLQDSPGIQTRSSAVRKLAGQLSQGRTYPWDQAKTFSAWIRDNIRPQVGPYTSVLKALESRRGDCEEMAAVFVSLCRAVDIPARLVWVPNHNWAEFFLVDGDGKGHWIPAHTASYFWFGWTGAHEMVLQKGDRIDVPETRGKERLVRDWMRYTGRSPRVRYLGKLKPLPAKPGADIGPGTRTKNEKGQWQLTGGHKLDPYQRR
jgi:hypothetical protein